MKRIICLFVAVIAITAAASAQQKGEKYLGGSLGVATTTSIANSTSATSFGLSLAPEFGYFVADKFRISASVGYGLETANRTDPVTHTITVMPELAYYVRLADNFYYTPSFQFGFACGIAGKTEMTNSFAMPGFGIGLSLGAFEFRPTRKFGVSFSLLSLEYVFTSYKGDYLKYNHNGISFRLGGSSTIGLRYYF